MLSEKHDIYAFPLNLQILHMQLQENRATPEYGTCCCGRGRCAKVAGAPEDCAWPW